MRVISGKDKARRLKAVSGMKTRPTTDKVKESLFNMIGPYFDGGIGLDLFAGSGGLGIEGLSRGLDRVIFIDKGPQAIATIHENIKQLSLTERSEVYRNDAKRALQILAKRKLPFSYIFLDPPYYKQELIQLLEIISNHQLLTEDGLIIVEHAQDVTLPDCILKLIRTRTEQYGVTKISFYQWDEEKE